MARHVRMFKPRFAPAVKSGLKCCTIRPTPKRAIRAGDTLDAREWTGRPYASKQRHLREAVVERVTPIKIDSAGCVILGGEYLSVAKIAELAYRDGFSSWMEMMDFFHNEHGLPFNGVLIEWKPPLKK